jgi:hypothetical protein
MWFVALAWITTMGAIAVTAENLALVAVLGTLALGSAFAAEAEFLGSATGTGWAFVLSAGYAWYTASALMFEGVWGRPVLPVGMTRHAKEAPDIAVGAGEPGVQRASRSRLEHTRKVRNCGGRAVSTPLCILNAADPRHRARNCEEPHLQAAGSMVLKQNARSQGSVVQERGGFFVRTRGRRRR